MSDVLSKSKRRRKRGGRSVCGTAQCKVSHGLMEDTQQQLEALYLGYEPEQEMAIQETWGMQRQEECNGYQGT